MHKEIISLSADSISLPKRQRNSHKSNYGRILILGGSVGYTGAVSMCAKACLRAGAGLVSVGVPEEVYPIVAAKQDEAMVFPLSAPLQLSQVAERLEACDVCVIGPGLGRSDDALQFARAVIAAVKVPVVIDADGLFAVKDDLHLLKGNIITPHRGEFARLGGACSGDAAADAAAFTEALGCITVLKGPDTAIAFPNGRVYLSRLGNPGMAVGGSGDVLAGIIGGLLGQLPVEQAVTAAVCIHGAAGDLCAAELGEYSMLPTDLIEMLPRVMKPMIER